MQCKLFKATLLTAFLMILLGLSVAGNSAASQQTNPSNDQKYIGTWTGDWSAEDGSSGSVTLTLSKDEKDQWRGMVRYTVSGGEETGDLKSLSIADGKLKAKIDDPDGETEITLEGEFKDDQIEGTFSVSPKGSTEIVSQGRWKATKSPPEK